MEILKNLGGAGPQAPVTLRLCAKLELEFPIHAEFAISYSPVKMYEYFHEIEAHIRGSRHPLHLIYKFCYPV